MPATDSDILTDGFRVLRRISIEEIERRVAWLENAVAAYKTLLVVKQVMVNQPAGLQTPPDWEPLDKPEPVAESLQRTPTGRLRRGQLRPLVVEALKQKPAGAKCAEIARHIGSTVASVNAELQRGRGQLYERIGHALWVYCGDGNPAVIAELAAEQTGNAAPQCAEG